MSALQKESSITEATESQIATILQYRYGDGMVYLPGHKPKALFSVAMERGFIDSEGAFSGSGSFTISTSENLVAGTAGLEAFEYNGLCAGYVCNFDLEDLTSTGSAT